jgi:hypothetical protein
VLDLLAQFLGRCVNKRRYFLITGLHVLRGATSHARRRIG